MFQEENLEFQKWIAFCGLLSMVVHLFLLFLLIWNLCHGHKTNLTNSITTLQSPRLRIMRVRLWAVNQLTLSGMSLICSIMLKPRLLCWKTFTEAFSRYAYTFAHHHKNHHNTKFYVQKYLYLYVYPFSQPEVSCLQGLHLPIHKACNTHPASSHSSNTNFTNRSQMKEKWHHKYENEKFKI